MALNLLNGGMRLCMVSPPITGDSNCKKNSSSLLLKPGSGDADISRTSSGSCGSCCSFLSSRNRHVNQDFESLKISSTFLCCCNLIIEWGEENEKKDGSGFNYLINFMRLTVMFFFFTFFWMNDLKVDAFSSSSSLS